MGTAVLRPHNLMVERFRIQATTSFQHRRTFAPRRKSNNSFHINNSSQKYDHKNTKKLVNGQVSLLRRGESLDSHVSKMNGCDQTTISPARKPETGVRGIKRTGTRSPDAICVPQANVYAGSAFFSSPSPRSLPQPSFSNKKPVNEHDLAASRDLRRLLRLDSSR